MLTHCPTTASDWLTGRGRALRTTSARHRASTSGSSEDPLGNPAHPNCGESPSSRGVLGTVPPNCGLTARRITPSGESVHILGVTVTTHTPGEAAPMEEAP